MLVLVWLWVIISILCMVVPFGLLPASLLLKLEPKQMMYLVCGSFLSVVLGRISLQFALNFI